MTPAARAPTPRTGLTAKPAAEWKSSFPHADPPPPSQTDSWPFPTTQGAEDEVEDEAMLVEGHPQAFVDFFYLTHAGLLPDAAEGGGAGGAGAGGAAAAGGAADLAGAEPG